MGPGENNSASTGLRTSRPQASMGQQPSWRCGCSPLWLSSFSRMWTGSSVVPACLVSVRPARRITTVSGESRQSQKASPSSSSAFCCADEKAESLGGADGKVEPHGEDLKMPWQSGLGRARSPGTILALQTSGCLSSQPTRRMSWDLPALFVRGLTPS